MATPEPSSQDYQVIYIGKSKRGQVWAGQKGVKIKSNGCVIVRLADLGAGFSEEKGVKPNE